MAYNSHQRWVRTVDQMGREIRFPYPPLRIVSLVPSQTELLFDLGLRKRLEDAVSGVAIETVRGVGYLLREPA